MTKIQVCRYTKQEAVSSIHVSLGHRRSGPIVLEVVIPDEASLGTSPVWESSNLQDVLTVLRGTGQGLQYCK